MSNLQGPISYKYCRNIVKQLCEDRMLSVLSTQLVRRFEFDNNWPADHNININIQAFLRCTYCSCHSRRTSHKSPWRLWRRSAWGRGQECLEIQSHLSSPAWWLAAQGHSHPLLEENWQISGLISENTKLSYKIIKQTVQSKCRYNKVCCCF